MNKAIVAGCIFGAIVLGLMIWSSIGLRTWRVEVCVEYEGRRSCRTASGASRESALRTAMDNACALIASGVTDTRLCGSTPPVSVRWIEGK